MSLVSGEKSNFQFILRLLNTNVRLPRNDWTARGGIRDAMEKYRWDGKCVEMEWAMDIGQYANAYTTG